jgi:hypothetical protein
MGFQQVLNLDHLGMGFQQDILAGFSTRHLGMGFQQDILAWVFNKFLTLTILTWVFNKTS